MISVFAPGKIILFGEHAVVYGYPALAIPILQVGVTVSISAKPYTNSIKPLSEKGRIEELDWMKHITVNAPGIGWQSSLAESQSNTLSAPIISTILNVFRILNISSPPPMHIEINSSIPVASGMGSGAAVSVALIRTLSSFLGKELSNEAVNQLAFECEIFHHGTPSGIDNTVITYSQPVFFIKDTPIEIFKVGKPFTLVVANSGIRAATREAVASVRKLWEENQDNTDQIFSSISDTVVQARQAILEGDQITLGILMNRNHNLLQQLKVSSSDLDFLTFTALNSGALGAKLSGGGLGGNIIALVQPENAEMVASALHSAGATETIISTVV
jgi:mevalonate kinase